MNGAMPNAIHFMRKFGSLAHQRSRMLKFDEKKS
jgi:hypothetical protein